MFSCVVNSGLRDLSYKHTTFNFSERRHHDSNDDSSVQHLTIQKPVSKLNTLSKSKYKSSPRNSPKHVQTAETNVLDKYKLPKAPSSRQGGAKLVPRGIDHANSTLLKHLSSSPSQLVHHHEDKETDHSVECPSHEGGSSTLSSKVSGFSTPKGHNRAEMPSNTLTSRRSLAKRLLNSTLTETSESEPPKKMMSTHGENLDTEVQNLQTSGLRNLGRRSKISAASRSATADHAATNVRNKSESAAEPEFKQPTTERLLVPTTKDKHIPCKGVP